MAITFENFYRLYLEGHCPSHVELLHHSVNNEQMATFIEILKKEKGIKKLKIHINPTVFDLFVGALHPQCEIEELELSFGYVTDRQAMALAQSISKCKTLRTLNLSYNQLGKTDAIVTALSRALVNNTQLKSLDLSAMGITDQGLEALAILLDSNLLEHNRSLVDLKLSNNEFTIVGLKKLLSVIPRTSIQRLHLNGNNINNEGCQYIAEVLKTNTQLTHLCLKNNKIGIQGVTSIANGIIANKTLSMLDLGGNKFQDKGAKVLFEALHTNTTLTQLELQACQIENIDWDELSLALKDNASICQVSLDYNKLNPKNERQENELSKKFTENKQYESTSRLSFAMGFHPRVGQNSVLSKIKRDYIFDSSSFKQILQFHGSYPKGFVDGQPGTSNSSSGNKSSRKPPYKAS